MNNPDHSVNAGTQDQDPEETLDAGSNVEIEFDTDDSIGREGVANVNPDSQEIDPEDIQRLVNELDGLVERLKATSPGYTPPPYSPQRLIRLLESNIDRFSPEFSSRILEILRSSINEDLIDPDTWKGTWYMLNYYLDYQGDKLKRRLSGEYETDEWGLDPEFLDTIRPIFDFLYKKYWRVATTGMENVPEEGRALLVSNHSGQIPWDGTMIGNAVLNEHINARLVRGLYSNKFPSLPFLSSFLVKVGQTLALEENGIRLLEQEEVVLVFPEGMKGISKLFKDRYQLARFGRGGFVRMALKTGAPIIPISVVGAEETYITLRHTPAITKLTGLPFPPMSLRWPWFGPLGLVPLPTKWYIDIGAPIPVDQYGPEGAQNLILVSQLTNQVRNVIQKMIYERLTIRQSIFFG